MDQRRFDDLTRALARGASRRSLLKGIFGAAAGAVAVGAARPAGAVPSAPVSARARPANATCVRNDQCASGICDPRTRRCACPVWQVACGNGCVDPIAFESDPKNCGACGTRCPAPANATAICVQGACDTVCNGGSVACGAACPKCQTLDCDCLCACDAGTVACGGSCVSPCPAGQTLDGACACACDNGGSVCGVSADICCDGNRACVNNACCVGEESACAMSADCCGTLVCSGGTCGFAETSRSPSDPRPGGSTERSPRCRGGRLRVRSPSSSRRGQAPPARAPDR